MRVVVVAAGVAIKERAVAGRVRGKECGEAKGRSERSLVERLRVRGQSGTVEREEREG